MNPWRGLRELPRGVWIVCAAMLVNRAGTMVLPFLVLYLSQSRGIAPTRAALALTVYGVAAMIAGPIAGRLCDRVGTIQVMKASLFASGAMLLVLPLAQTLTAILAMTAVWSFVSEAVRPAALAAVAEQASPGQRRAAFALIRLAVNLGMSVGPAVGGFLAAVSFRALFWADSVTSLLAGVVLVLWPLHVAGRAGSAAELLEEPADVARDIEAESATPPTAALPSDLLGVLRDPRLVYFLLALIPVLLVFFQISSALPLYLVQHRGLPESFFGLIFTLNTLLIVALEVPLNLAMAHWKHRHALALGAMLYAAGFGALALVEQRAAILATVVIWTFGEMILLPASAAYIAEIAPAGKQGECMGVYSMTFSLAFAVGPWLGATVLQRFGPEVLWAATFVSGSLAALLMSRVRGSQEAEGGTGVASTKK